jgi:hypothetical protein
LQLAQLRTAEHELWIAQTLATNVPSLAGVVQQRLTEIRSLLGADRVARRAVAMIRATYREDAVSAVRPRPSRPMRAVVFSSPLPVPPRSLIPTGWQATPCYTTFSLAIGWS